MYRCLNRVMLIGFVGKDPEITAGEGNGKNRKKAYGRFSLATRETKDATEWHNVVVFEGLASVIETLGIKKGSHLCIHGRVNTRQWIDKETGEKRSRKNIIADELILLDRRESSSEDEETVTDQAVQTACSEDPFDN